VADGARPFAAVGVLVRTGDVVEFSPAAAAFVAAARTTITARHRASLMESDAVLRRSNIQGIP